MPRKPIMVSVNLPFPGFYGSDLSDAFDHEAESYLERFTTDDDTSENAYPGPLRLVNDMGELLYDATNYRAGYDYLARQYVASFNYVAGEALGFTAKGRRKRTVWTGSEFRDEGWEIYTYPTLRAEFEETVSPREYNFTTDRVFALIPLKIMRELYKRSAAEKHATLARVIRSTFTSYDGFRSFYSNDLSSWTAKPLTDWDYNELGTLLIAALDMSGEFKRGDYYSSLEGRVFEDMSNSGDFSTAFDCAVDWEKLERLKEHKRAEKLEAWREADPEAAAAYAGEALGGLVAVRCPEALDLFASDRA